ncbi:hypothetical protein ACP4OV_018852 [Aristida adscensionis]
MISTAPSLYCTERDDYIDNLHVWHRFKHHWVRCPGGL